MNKLPPLLSICIPTFNRGSILEKTLNSYINSKRFDEVEIIISDNASSDNTIDVCNKYTAKYKNIKYFRNRENIKDSNFSLVLDRASGYYLKLMNDSMLVHKEALNYMLSVIAAHSEDRTPIFFTGGKCSKKTNGDIIVCNSFGEYVVHLSYRVTANQCFGAWREDWNKVAHRNKYSKLMLNQVDWSYQILERQNAAILCTKPYYSLMEVGKRKGYNWFLVHITNYYTILQPYIIKGLLTNQQVREEKINHIKGLKAPLLKKYGWNILPNWEFEMTGATKILFNTFGRIPYFYAFMITLPIWGTFLYIKFLIRNKVYGSH